MSDKKNAVGGEREYWGVVPVMPAQQLMETAKLMEDLGYTGAFSYQVFGPPFIPLAVAAAATTRLKVASGIAIAGTRSPFETAMAAIDVDRISEGRFILGLGSSAPVWTQDIFGSPPYKPIAHLRDTVAAVRHIVAGAHCGLEPFDGEYYKAYARYRTDKDQGIKTFRPAAAYRNTHLGGGTAGKAAARRG